MGHKTRYSEIVLVGLVATLASYNYTITIDNFALPHKVAMYSVKPVLQHDSAFDVFDVAHSAAKTHHFHDVIFDAAFVPVSRSGDFDFHYMTAIQIAKFSIGCYSNNSLTDTGLNSWKRNVVDIWTTHNAAAKANGTLLLDKWQAAGPSLSTGRQGVCECIDDAIDATTTAGSSLPATYTTKGNLYGLTIKPNTVGVEGNGQHYARIVGFCQTSAIPMHVIQYEGTVGVPALLLAAQLCILLGLVHLWDLYLNRISVQSVDRGDFKSSGNKSRRMLKIFLSFLVFILYMVRQSYDTNHFDDADPKQPGYRSVGHTRAKYTATNFVVVGSLFVVLLVELIYEYVASHCSGEHTRVRYHKNSTMARVVERVGADVPTIVGFGLMGLAVLLQADVTNSTSVLGGVFILFTAGLVQHVSNVVKILYESLCARLSSEVVVGLALHDETAPTTDNDEVKRILSGAITDGASGSVAANKGNGRIREVLQFFGWTRLYLFIAVVLLGVSFFTFAKDSSITHMLKGMLDGQLLYFTFAFVFAHVGFDALYELMPMSFDPQHSEKLKIYFVCVYLIVFNFNQILHVRSAVFRGEVV